jgi:tryptophan-rich sensory protein
VVLASLSSTGYWLVIGGWLALCALVFLFSPRDVQGRRRATGCIFGLIVFFGAFFVAFAAWAADHIF